MGTSKLAEDACSYYQRQQLRDADQNRKNAFGASPYDFMSKDQAEARQQVQDEHDRKDPPCGQCSVCKEAAAEDAKLPEWARQSRTSQARKGTRNRR